ncbi:unnamed protein product [Rotaria socialis]|uniref:Reverse transcriptase domain-containing protein n=1 Tax=Rotaria socialis TaxID=392032 RepID=A0A817UFX4_9BILA|nr:unnamed protein product [Rotaria socialis]
MSTTFSKLSAATKPFYPSSINNLKEIAMCQIRQWSFKTSDQILIDAVLTEWLTAGTLEKALKQWENITTEESVTGQASLNIFCYNVQGWGSRSLEVTKIVFKIEAPIGGTNKSGGVCVAIRKHLKVCRVSCNIDNTVIVDVIGLSEIIRIIGMYWPAGQMRGLEELDSFIINNTIIMGDSNASIKEWGKAHDNTDKAFWLHLPTVYKRNSLPFTKLGTGNTVLSEEKEINEGLFRYYSEQFKAQNTDKSDPNEAQIEIKYQAKILTLNKLKEGIPRCEQTRPISLLAAYSKLFEKIVLERVRFWAESNKLLPEEQSGFRPGCLLPTRVLSIYKEIKNNMTANIPTAAIYVDYPKAYDIVSDKGLIVKLNRLNIFAGLLKLIISWLSDRYAYVVFGSSKSNAFPIHLGLPQAAADEYIDLYSSRSKIKLAAKQQRILCTRLISTAWVRTQNSIDFERAFFDIGYTWIDESPVSIRTLQGFLFDPSTVTSSITDVDDREEQEECREKKKMVEENKKHSHLSSMKNNSKLKQLSLDQFIKN